MSQAASKIIPATTDDDMLRTPEVARLIGVELWTVINWRRRPGVGPRWRRCGARAVRYRRGDVRAWLASQEFGGEGIA